MTMIFLVTISIGEVDAYAQLSDALALQQVINQGGKIFFSHQTLKCFFCSSICYSFDGE
jgi:hypothetical protein